MRFRQILRSGLLKTRRRNRIKLVVASISEPSLDPLPSGHLLQAHNNTGSRASLMAEDEGGVSPEINSSTSQSGEDPSLQLVRVLFLLTVILPPSES